MILPTLFHWSPLERREQIRVEGLKPYSPTAVTSDPALEWAHGFGCICLGPSPARAWSLSGDMQHVSEIEQWDLWEVVLAATDEVRVRGEFGPEIKEVRVFNPIPADRLWWVATRS
jgi:hypothetical protein